VRAKTESFTTADTEATEKAREDGKKGKRQ
jgi:hypothetical protein